MSSTEPLIAASLATDPDLAPAPLDPSWIVEGSPKPRSRHLAFPTEGTIGAMLWETSGGRFDWHYGGDEIIYILDGLAELTSANGSVRTVRQGDMVYFPGGQTVHWHVPEYVRKVTLHNTQVILPRRVVRRLVRMLHGGTPSS